MFFLYTVCPETKMYALYRHLKYLKFKQKYEHYRQCFRTIFLFFMAMIGLMFGKVVEQHSH